MVLALPGGQQFRSEFQLSHLIVGSMEGKGQGGGDMQRRRLEVLCVQEIKWKGGSSRRFVPGYKLLHVGGHGRRNGFGIIVSREISKQVVIVER